MSLIRVKIVHLCYYYLTGAKNLNFPIFTAHRPGSGLTSDWCDLCNVLSSKGFKYLMAAGLNRICILVLFLVAPGAPANAQHIWYEAFGGPSFSFVSKEHTSATYGHKFGLHGGINAFIPFNNKVAFKTGAVYQLKRVGSKGDGVNRDTAGIHYTFQSNSSYHTISVPIQLAVNIGDNPQGFWRVAAGMNYGFIIAAKKVMTFQTYEDNELVRDNKVSFKPVIGSERSGSRPGLPGQEGTPVKFFVPALRFDVTYHWQERILLSAFYEYDLEDVRVRTVENSKARFHSTGVSFGVLFW